MNRVHPHKSLPDLSFANRRERRGRGTFDAALGIACATHRNQVDKGGEPYIMHPIRVAQAVWHLGPTHRIVAVLHDVIEDGKWQITMLCEEFGVEIIAALDALTRRKGEDYMQYLARVKEDAIARVVKLADLRDNMDPARPTLDEGTAFRMSKYAQVVRFLSGE